MAKDRNSQIESAGEDTHSVLPSNLPNHSRRCNYSYLVTHQSTCTDYCVYVVQCTLLLRFLTFMRTLYGCMQEALLVPPINFARKKERKIVI